MKRVLDFVLSFGGLLLLTPLLVPLSAVVWLQDFHSPFYIPSRVGRGGRNFRMVKLRSMIVKADRSGVDSTAANDPRITPIGHFIRRFKLDEIPQLWNVLIGDMSLVGPRPNVKTETALYTVEEKRLLSVRPGITDLASIVFADEAEILKGAEDPDLAYNQIIRPWKSRLGLLYVENASVGLDLRILFLTAIALLSRPLALEWTERIVRRLGGSPELCRIVRRHGGLPAAPPPGATEIVRSRKITA